MEGRLLGQFVPVFTVAPAPDLVEGWAGRSAELPG